MEARLKERIKQARQELIEKKPKERQAQKETLNSFSDSFIFVNEYNDKVNFKQIDVEELILTWTL